MLRRALMYACELQHAQPRAPARLHTREDTSRGQGSPLRQQTSSDEYNLASPMPGVAQSSTPVVGLPQPQGPGPVQAHAKRNLTVQVFLHCARIDVSSLLDNSTQQSACKRFLVFLQNKKTVHLSLL